MQTVGLVVPVAPTAVPVVPVAPTAVLVVPVAPTAVLVVPVAPTVVGADPAALAAGKMAPVILEDAPDLTVRQQPAASEVVSS